MTSRPMPLTSRAREAHVSAAVRFADLHAGPEILIVPNVWDVLSARMLAALPGVQALGTTSMGIAAAAGCADGEVLGRDGMLAVSARICRSVDKPVTVDLEGGYGITDVEVACCVGQVLAAGAVGVNIEDGRHGGGRGLRDIDTQASMLAAARQAIEQAGVPCVINARTDTYWRSAGKQDGQFVETVDRLRAYRSAGADCVFVPGFPAPQLPGAKVEVEIGRLVDALEGTPVNLLWASHLPPIDRLRQLGVRRLSMGSALFRLAYAEARAAFAELVDTGTGAALGRAARLPYTDAAELLADKG